MMPVLRIVNADCVAYLNSLPEKSFHGLVTDPPYGLSPDQPPIQEVIRAWMAGEPYRSGRRGFMGRKWDGFVPGPEVWRAVYRVLTPGALGLVFAGSRTWDLMALGLRLAGFYVDDTVFSYTTGKGFPKYVNVPRVLDELLGHDRSAKDPIVTEEAQEYEDYGTALKPCMEPILLIQRPLEGTIPENILKYGTGALDIGAGRVLRNDPTSTHSRSEEAGKSKGVYGDRGRLETHQSGGQEKGSFPGNLVLVHSPHCIPVARQFEDDPVPVFACIPTCPVRQLDDHNARTVRKKKVPGAKRGDARPTEGVSQFFNTFAWADHDPRDVFPIFYTTKVDDEEREAGCEHLPTRQMDEGREADAPGANNPRNRGGEQRHNAHPCLKSIELIRWCLRLVTPPGDDKQILDPFVGSGTTLASGALEDINVTGIERDREEGYLDTGIARTVHWARVAREQSGGTFDISALRDGVLYPFTLDGTPTLLGNVPEPEPPAPAHLAPLLVRPLAPTLEDPESDEPTNSTPAQDPQPPRPPGGLHPFLSELRALLPTHRPEKS